MAQYKKDNVTLLITGVNFPQKVEEYHLMNTQKKALTDKMENLKANLKAYIQKNGVKNSDTGTFMIETQKLIAEERAVKKVIPSLDKVIINFANRPEIISEVVKVTTYLDEEALEKLLSQDIISTQDIENICDINTSYAFYVTQKEEMPEAERSTFTSAVAQRRKPVLRPRT